MYRISCAILLVMLVAGPVAAQDGGEAATHVVQPGENLFRIALRYDTTVSAIMLANDLTSMNLIYPGQELRIPDLGTAPAGGASGAVTHTVAPGENLFRISRGYGVSMSAIMAANGITDPDLLYAGQALTIPAGGAPAGPSPASASESAPAASSGSMQHTVSAGENLFRIALRYGVSLDALAAANGIADPEQIYAGQVLTIPGEAAPTASDSSAAAAPAGQVYLNVPVVRQSNNLSCESASVCSAMRYMGYPCDSDVYVFNALPQSYDNPHRGFVGPVTSAPGTLPPGAATYKTGGYGVYVEPISAALTGLGVNHGHTYFASLDMLRQLLKAGIPVVIIATHGLGIYGEPLVAFTPTDGDGGTVTVIRYEHSYTLVGYDAGGFWAIDPWSGGVDYFTVARLDADWARLGRQAVWILP
ncbi:MAG: LysM peptidoglycan-binding domain-containing protein [Anaerolineae bacterium]|nr:LysM peptidoglycan-binding domain-containing protein [Anaerolineae bacterium]